jgi:hypothetical protein
MDPGLIGGGPRRCWSRGGWMFDRATFEVLEALSAFKAAADVAIPRQRQQPSERVGA